MISPMGLPVFAACFVLGVITAASVYVFSRRRNFNSHHENHDDQQNESSSGQARNLTCPFCGRPTVSNDYPLVCGHLCHVTCFREQPASSRNRCSFCYADQNEEVIRGVSTSRLHEEVRQRLNRQPPPEINENDPTSKPPPESRTAEPPKEKIVNCAFCRIQLELPANDNRYKQLNCSHYAHEKCFESFKYLGKCQTCGSDSSDSEDEVAFSSHFVGNN